MSELQVQGECPTDFEVPQGSKVARPVPRLQGYEWICKECHHLLWLATGIDHAVLTMGGLGPTHCHVCGRYGECWAVDSVRPWLRQALERMRPIPVTERLPEIPAEACGDLRVQMYDQRLKRWEYGNLYRIEPDGELWCRADSALDGDPLASHTQFTHWLPDIPKPEASATLFGKKPVIDPSINPDREST